jgi:hypothetical protein
VVLAVVGTLVACSGEPPANDLEVGDCIEDEADLNETSLAAIDCDDEHRLELIGKFDVDDEDEYPGEDALRSEGDERCADLYEDDVGSPLEEGGDVVVTAVLPSEDSWSDGDRTILCFAHAADLSETTGSIAADDES